MEKAIKKVTCCNCGKEEDASRWMDDWANEMVEHQMCFTCNHWRRNYVEDCKDGPHTWAVVNGGHYRLCPPTNSYFKGFGGTEFTFRFNDGVIVKCNNTWFQGEIKDAHPHWLDVMPNNAILIWDDKREYHQINELINEELKALFCEEHHYEDIMIHDDHIVAVKYETTEVYYGSRLVQPIIVDEFPIEIVEKWMEERLKSTNK